MCLLHKGDLKPESQYRVVLQAIQCQLDEDRCADHCLSLLRLFPGKPHGQGRHWMMSLMLDDFRLELLRSQKVNLDEHSFGDNLKPAAD